MAGGGAAGAGAQTARNDSALAPLSLDEIRAGVVACVAAALHRTEAGIAPGTRIIAELGADSLDLLDITFRLEQKFGISISPRDMERRIRQRLGEAPLDIDGVYTPQALEEFRRSMPEIPSADFPEGLAVADLPRLFRVATLMNLVTRLLKEQRG
jgi:acyl carrier protein